MTQSEFNALWEIDKLPACPSGMVLLRNWAETLPPVKNVRRLVFPAMEDGINSTEPKWVALQQHLSTCADCNEGVS